MNFYVRISNAEGGVCALSDKSLGYRAVEALMRVYGTRRITDRSYEGLLRYAARATRSCPAVRRVYCTPKYAVEPFSVAVPAIIARRGRRAEKAVLFSARRRVRAANHALPLSLDCAYDRRARRMYMCRYPLAGTLATARWTICCAITDVVLQSYVGADVTFAGDSAGGSLCLSLAMLARNRAQPLPARLVLLSPCCSLCATEKQLAVMREIESAT